MHTLKTQLVSMYHQLYFLPPLSCFHAHLLALSLHSFMQVHNTTFQIKTVFNNVLFSTEGHNPLHAHLLALSHISYKFVYKCLSLLKKINHLTVLLNHTSVHCSLIILLLLLSFIEFHLWQLTKYYADKNMCVFFQVKLSVLSSVVCCRCSVSTQVAMCGGLSTVCEFCGML